MEGDITAAPESPNNPVVKKMTPEELEEYNRRENQKGLIYIARIPPGMNPHNIQPLLAPFGDLGRIFLKPADKESKKVNKEGTGKGKGKAPKRFVCGWVEFLDKRRAKRAADLLHNSPVGGKRRSHFHDDLWNIKYLHKVKWNHLTEAMAHERAVREYRIRQEFTQAKRENAYYLERVEEARQKRIVEEKREKKKRKRDTTD